MLPLYGFLSFSGVSTAVITSVSGLGGDLGTLLSLGMMTLPTIPVLVYQLRKTKRALAAGYRLSDLRFALRTWSAERIGELDRGRESHLARIASWIPLQSGFLYLTSLVALFSTPPFTWPAVLLGKLAVFAGVTSLAGLSVFGLPLVPKWLQRRMIGRARGWLWNSRFGSWLADRLAPKGGGVPLAAFRPTEMALEVAIDDLFAALPDEYRDSLRDLPAIARRLTARAAQLREALTIDVGPEGDPDHTWQELKNANSARLKETVTALERLRLGLLRLHGGMADLRPVTTALEAARAMDRDMAASRRRAGRGERRSTDPEFRAALAVARLSGSLQSSLDPGRARSDTARLLMCSMRLSCSRAQPGSDITLPAIRPPPIREKNTGTANLKPGSSFPRRTTKIRRANARKNPPKADPGNRRHPRIFQSQPVPCLSRLDERVQRSV